MLPLPPLVPDQSPVCFQTSSLCLPFSALTALIHLISFLTSHRDRRGQGRLSFLSTLLWGFLARQHPLALSPVWSYLFRHLSKPSRVVTPEGGTCACLMSVSGDASEKWPAKGLMRRRGILLWWWSHKLRLSSGWLPLLVLLCPCQYGLNLMAIII